MINYINESSKYSQLYLLSFSILMPPISITKSRTLEAPRVAHPIDNTPVPHPISTKLRSKISKKNFLM